MDYFDGLLDETSALLSDFPRKEYPYGKKWQDVGRNSLVLKRDEAFELDGVGYNLVTARDIGESGITVIGRELSQISGETRFARVSLLQMNGFDDEQKAYDTIRKVEYAKYHYFPKGFMVRTVSTSHKEAIRVTKEALKSGITFEKVGGLLISKYLENPSVRAARIIYVTEQSADFEQLEKIAQRNYEITETLNHIMQNVQFDCDVCKLKKICDEVEGLRELHFKTAGMM